MKKPIITSLLFVAAICTAFLSRIPAFAQQPASQIQLQPPPPTAPAPNATVVGQTGGQIYYYYVIARYPIGGAISAPVLVANAPASLSGSNSVAIGWQPLTAATGYDVIRLALPVFNGTSCSSCLLVSNTPGTNVQDTGTTLTSYTAPAIAPSASGSFYINNLNYGIPEMRQIVKSLDLPIDASGTLSIQQFGALCDGHSNDYAAIISAQSYAALSRKILTLPGGVCAFASPLVVTDDLTFWRGNGTRLKYIGLSTTYALTFDGSASGNGKKFNVSDILVDANGLASYAVRYRLTVGSAFTNIQATNATIACFINHGNTTSTLNNPTCSSLAEPFTTTPVNGIAFALDPITGGQSSNVIVSNMKIEGTSGDGVLSTGSLGTYFIGGTSESNGGWGFHAIGGSAIQSTFIGTDFESNTLGDALLDSSVFNLIINAVSASSIGVKLINAATANTVIGGEISNINFSSNSKLNSVFGTSFTNSGGISAQWIDTSIGNTRRGAIDAFTGVSMVDLFPQGISITSTADSSTSNPIGGSALLAGACALGAVPLIGVSTSSVILVTPVTYPGDGNWWDAYVSGPSTVTIRVCAAVAGTPTASEYNVRVIR